MTQHRDRARWIESCKQSEARALDDRFCRRCSDRGSVTAEFAVALPAVLVLLMAISLGAVTGWTQVQAEGAARAAARSLARGDDDASARAVAQRQAGDAARVQIMRTGTHTTVVVANEVSVAGGLVLPITLTADAVVLDERPAVGP